MPEREFEIYLSVLSRLLRLSEKQKDAIADELRDHLEERLADLMQSGMSREEAIQQALEEFGDVSGLALEFTNVSRIPLRRLVMKTTLVTGIVGAIFLLGFFMFAPEPEQRSQLVSVAHAQQEKTESKAKAQPTASVKKSIYLQDQELFPDALSQSSVCNFSDTPLADALHFFSSQHEITILLDMKALEEAAIAPDAPITLTLGGDAQGESKFTLEELLNVMCKPLNLGWYVDGDIITVSTMDACQQHQQTRHYDLSPLHRMGYSIERLRDAIMLVGIGWESDGSGTGTWSIFGETISVRQSYETHRQISRLLAALEKPDRVTEIEPCSNRERIRTGLITKIDCNFADTPLSDAVEYISTAVGIPILISKASLESTGIKSDAPVTLSLTQKPAEQVLRLMLRPLLLTTTLRHGALHVVTFDDAANNLRNIAYDVSHLVSVKEASKEGAELLPSDEEKTEQLQNLILAVHSQGWGENGSGAGKLMSLEAGIFVICQTDVMHSEIQATLAQLHAAAERSRKSPITMPQEKSFVTRSYLVSKEAATDLSTSLRNLVVVSSWNQAINGELPSLHVVAAEPRLQEVEGRVVSGPFEVRVPEPAAPAKPVPGMSGTPAPGAKPELTKSILVRPQANLVIRQTPENQRAIERFIRNLTGDLSLRGYDPNVQQGGAGLNGGGFF